MHNPCGLKEDLNGVRFAARDGADLCKAALNKVDFESEVTEELTRNVLPFAIHHSLPRADGESAGNKRRDRIRFCRQPERLDFCVEHIPNMLLVCFSSIDFSDAPSALIEKNQPVGSLGQINEV